jgi:hypothetical protein
MLLLALHRMGEQNWSPGSRVSLTEAFPWDLGSHKDSHSTLALTDLRREALPAPNLCLCFPV